MISILAAVVILGGVLSASLHHASQRKSNTELNLALAACTNTLEELRSLPFADVPTMDGEDFDIPGVNGQPGGLLPVPGDTDAPGLIQVRVDRSSGGAVLYWVTASVTWQGTLGSQTIELDTLMGERK